MKVCELYTYSLNQMHFPFTLDMISITFLLIIN
jgi:hypothetical protein